MTMQETTDEADIRGLISKLAAGIRARDLESLRACFAADMVSFDVGPPLQHLGVEAKLNNWREAFTVLQPPINYEIRELSITVGEDVAFAHGINRLSGMLNESRFGPWVRWTACFRKTSGSWLIAHDQVSLPVDHLTGRAVIDLAPDEVTV